MIIQIYPSLTIIGLLVGLFSTDEQWWGGLHILKVIERHGQLMFQLGMRAPKCQQHCGLACPTVCGMKDNVCQVKFLKINKLFKIAHEKN